MNDDNSEVQMIMVDENGLTIKVYPALGDGDGYLELWAPVLSEHQRRHVAETFAVYMAGMMDCSWGTNY